MLTKTKRGGFDWTKPVIAEQARTFGEVMALPPAERERAWALSIEQVLAGMDQRDQKYLDADYEHVDGKPEYVWSEGEV